VTVAVLIPISGWAAERFGARRVFATAITVFTLASAGCALAPDLADLPAAMHRAGAPVVAISGAGPAHYGVVSAPDEAATLADRLTESLGVRACVFVAAPCLHPIQPVASEPGVRRQ